MRGVPLRLEIGPKDIEKSAVLLARRDTREKLSVPMDGLASKVREPGGPRVPRLVRGGKPHLGVMATLE